jgi:cysteine desulfuration protein SufE
MSQSPSFAEIEENLSFLDDWEDRYRYIIELGQALPPLAPAEHNAANKVTGCVSQVWLVSDRQPSPEGLVLNYRGDSDAMIVRGLVAILIALYSGHSAREISSIDAIAIFDRIGLREHLSTQRANGLAAMVNRIRGEARQLA